MWSSTGDWSIGDALCCSHSSKEAGLKEALSMSDEACAAHVRLCNPLLMSSHDCPVCEGIAFINDIELCSLAETRNMPIRRGDKHYARQERMSNTETMLRRRHAANLIAKHAADGTLDVLADCVLKAHGSDDALTEDDDYYALVRHSIQAAASDAGSYAAAVEVIADVMVFRSLNTAAQRRPVPSSVLRGMCESKLVGLFTPALETVLNMLVLQVLLPILETRVKTIQGRVGREGFLPSALVAKQARWILVFAVLCSPRAPQSSPFSGSNKAVATMGI